MRFEGFWKDDPMSCNRDGGTAAAARCQELLFTRNTSQLILQMTVAYASADRRYHHALMAQMGWLDGEAPQATGSRNIEMERKLWMERRARLHHNNSMTERVAGLFMPDPDIVLQQMRTVLEDPPLAMRMGRCAGIDYSAWRDAQLLVDGPFSTAKAVALLNNLAPSIRSYLKRVGGSETLVEEDVVAGRLCLPSATYLTLHSYARLALRFDTFLTHDLKYWRRWPRSVTAARGWYNRSHMVTYDVRAAPACVPGFRVLTPRAEQHAGMEERVVPHYTRAGVSMPRTRPGYPLQSVTTGEEARLLNRARSGEPLRPDDLSSAVGYSFDHTRGPEEGRKDAARDTYGDLKPT
jgi:hypothetical protein